MPDIETITNDSSFSRLMKDSKLRRKKRKAESAQLVDDRKHAKRVEIRLYEIERDFQQSPAKFNIEYLKLKTAQKKLLINDLVFMESTDPNVAELQGRIRAIHELVSPAIDPRDKKAPIPVSDDDDDDDDENA